MLGDEKSMIKSQRPLYHIENRLIATLNNVAWKDLGKMI